MSTQATIFDAIAAHELAARDRGMELAVAHSKPLPELARAIGHQHAREHGTVTIEDVRAGLNFRVPGWDHNKTQAEMNWMGMTFLGDKRFEATGEYVKTKHKGGHYREVMEWRLR